MPVSIGSVALAVTPQLYTLAAWCLYRKRPSLPLLWIYIAFLVLCTYSVTLFHLCAAADINYCPQSQQTQETMDTYSTFLAIISGFNPFYAEAIQAKFTAFLILFSYFLLEVLFDAFWSIFVIVPVASIPFAMGQQLRSVLCHPLQNWLHYVAVILGVTGVYFKYVAGNYPNASDYPLNHSLWHVFVGLGLIAFIENQPNETEYKALAVHPASIPLDFLRRW
jgi:hypothetical protein